MPSLKYYNTRSQMALDIPLCRTIKEQQMYVIYRHNSMLRIPVYFIKIRMLKKRKRFKQRSFTTIFILIKYTGIISIEL